MECTAKLILAFQSPGSIIKNDLNNKYFCSSKLRMLPFNPHNRKGANEE
jgi:hypothetical protein